jgi:hypothetical protein
VEILLIVLVIAALVGAVLWNKRNAAAATEGVRFTVAAPPQVVTDALRDAHCGEAKAMTRSALSGIRVTPVSPTSFRADSRLGDVASIEVQPHGGGSLVTASADELYVGSPPSVQFRSGVMGLLAAVMHRVNTVLGVSPGAAGLKRFQNGHEGRINRQLQRSARS